MKTYNSHYSNNYIKLCLTAFLLTAAVLGGFPTGCSRNIQEHAVKPEIRPNSTKNTVNINTASREELQKVPHIGAKIADEIIEHRERYGPFKRPEHLMLIRGISDKRFREIMDHVRVE